MDRADSHCRCSTRRQIQQRIPNELLSSLSTCLVQGQVFEILQMLHEVQSETEKQLFQRRLQRIRQTQGRKGRRNQVGKVLQELVTVIFVAFLIKCLTVLLYAPAKHGTTYCIVIVIVNKPVAFFFGRIIGSSS